MTLLTGPKLLMLDETSYVVMMPSETLRLERRFVFEAR